MLDWQNLYFPIGCGMVKGGVPTNVMVTQRPDGSFGPASDPTVTFVPVTTASPIVPKHSLGGGGGGSSGHYESTHHVGSHSGSTAINYNKPGNHGNHDDNGQNSHGEFQFSHQHVGPSGTSSVNFNYNGFGSPDSPNEGGLKCTTSFYLFIIIKY